jgi:UDP-N-acetylmuramoyl-tripeptide--D-alanyl-D-alanine ligase
MVRPDIFIMTKIGYAHLKELGDLNGVLRAKTEAFAYMKPDGVAVLNGDDELLWGYDPGMRKITLNTCIWKPSRISCSRRCHRREAAWADS